MPERCPKIAGALLCAIAAASAAPAAVHNFGRFGDVNVYGEGTPPRDVVLFMSGDGGWNLGVISMARRLTDKGALVAGIDIRRYLAQLEKSTDKCVSPSADLENLSRYLQSTLGLKDYVQPTLVGYSSGATLAYAALAQAPDGLFKGALSLGFCPDLDLKKPLCKGSGIEAKPRRGARGLLKGVDFLPANQLSGKWISLQGEIDQVCPAAPTQKFIEAVPGARIVLLPKVGHGYSVEKNWAPQYDAAYAEITGAPAQTPPPGLPAPVADLPLTLVPAASGDSSPWFGTPGGGMATAPELQRWSGAPYPCLYGEHDADSACADLTGKEGIAVKMPGGHHFGGSNAGIAAQILKRLPER